MRKQLAVLVLTLPLTGCNSFTPGPGLSEPTITSFTANPTAVTAGGSANLTGVFANGTGVITPGNITVTSGTAVSVSPAQTTTYILTVTNASGDTAVRTATVTVNAALTQQTITFANPGAQTVGTPLTLSATASSGLTVSFASTTTSVCTVSGTTATFLEAGTCSITASQAGNATYAAATPVTQSFTVNAMIPPAPTGLTATAGDAAVALSWTGSAGATSYNVYRGTTTGGESKTPVATGVTTTAYTDTGLTNGQEYFYEVAAVNNAGISPMSNEASATPSASACPVLTATDTGVAEIDLSWSVCPGATSYYILRSTTSGGPYTTVTVSTGTTYQDFGLVSMQKYYYVIRAISSAGLNVESNEANAVFTSVYVSQDANGWTTVIPSPNGKQYYVSSSTGNDSTGDGSQAKPFASIGKAAGLVRPGYPDWILLKAGDVWYDSFGYYEAIGGRSADEPMVFTSYGAGSRPQIRVTDSKNDCFDHFSGQTFSHFYFIGLECYDSRKDPSSPDYESSNGKATASDATGFSVVDNGDDILIEDNYFHFLAGGIVVELDTGPAPKNVRIRRNVITDQYAASGAHSQGAFLANIKNLLVEDNLFDHNAWNDQAGIAASIFNHHMYIVDSYMATIRNNLMLRDESLSLKLCSYAGTTDAFAGALLYNNLIFEGEVGISMGYGASAVLTGSAFTGFKIDNNILLQVDRDNPTGRGLGWGIDIQNVSESFFTNNIFTQFDTLYGNNIYAFNMGLASANLVASGNTIQDNLIYQDAGEAFILDSATTFTNIKIQDNTIQNTGLPTQSQVNYDPLMYEETGNSLAPYSFSGNTYYNAGPYNSDNSNSGFAFIDNGNILDTYSQWLTQSGETGSQIKQITYSDPNRTLESYDASLGGPSALNPIFAAIRSQSRATWNPAFTAQAVNDYIRNGFNLTSLGGGVGNTVTPPAPVTTLSATAGSASVTLNWTAPTGSPTFYIVYRGTTAGGENMVSPIATYVTGSPWTDTTAASGQTYYYQVASMNAGGFGGLSNEASATP
ncbi:MAG: fibronectin type III domain-containing protein [Terracidiphilus sp.]